MSLTAQAVGGDGWSRTDHLLALILDALRDANWQRGGKGPRPERIAPSATSGEIRYGQTNRSPEEVMALLARYGPQPDPDPGAGDGPAS